MLEFMYEKTYMGIRHFGFECWSNNAKHLLYTNKQNKYSVCQTICDEWKKYRNYLWVKKTNEWFIQRLNKRWTVNIKFCRCWKRKSWTDNFAAEINNKKGREILLQVLEKLLDQYPDTRESINSSMADNCNEENVSLHQVVSLFYFAFLCCCLYCNLWLAVFYGHEPKIENDAFGYKLET